jgi:hypothetical protein
MGNPKNPADNGEHGYGRRPLAESTDMSPGMAANHIAGPTTPNTAAQRLFSYSLSSYGHQ